VRRLLAAALRNRIAALGVALTTASAILFVLLNTLELAGLLRSPYAGILVFIAVPAVFVLGLLLIPVGLIQQRRKMRVSHSAWPTLDLRSPDMRRALLFAAGATVVNLTILAVASVGAVKYSGSQQFCGQSCHVMTPQFVAHQSGSHARVLCVSCHIEPGAQGFVRAKLTGTRQLALVVTGRYPAPIPSPPVTGIPNVHTSCEQCHWPDRFIGDVIKVAHEFADDEKNTGTKTTLRLHVGGPVTGTGNGIGIHWHMNRGNRVEYVALDSSLEEIPVCPRVDARRAVARIPRRRRQPTRSRREAQPSNGVHGLSQSSGTSIRRLA
jgi:nitrate/TMAO reductase-like tetraheme cytochrome c subunit